MRAFIVPLLAWLAEDDAAVIDITVSLRYYFQDAR